MHGKLLNEGLPSGKHSTGIAHCYSIYKHLLRTSQDWDDCCAHDPYKAQATHVPGMQQFWDEESQDLRRRESQHEEASTFSVKLSCPRAPDCLGSHLDSYLPAPRSWMNQFSVSSSIKGGIMTGLSPGVCFTEMIHEQYIVQDTEQMFKHRSYYHYIIVI